MQARDGGILFARTMDWHHIETGPLTLPKGYAWQSAYSGAPVTNKYTILGVGRNLVHSHADISDGVNEHGLAVQKLTFSNTSEYTVQADSRKLSLAPFEFVMWLLGNCRSLEEIPALLDQIELMTDDFAQTKYGRTDLHFSATDLSGRLISIEPLGGKLVIKENPIGVVTNAPKLEREIEKLEAYLDFDFSNQDLNKISTGNFSGKPVFPGGFTPTNRLIRAVILKERGQTADNETQNVIETFHILNSVTVPRSDGRSDTQTIYRSAVDCMSKTLYFQAYDDFGITSYRFPE